MYRSRLGRIIQVKERFVDDKRREIESINVDIDEISNGIDGMDNNINNNYSNITATALSGSDFCVLKEHIIYLENRKFELIKQRENLRVKASAVRSELFELVKEIKMLEILKSKALRTIKKSQNRREQKKLDDLALRINGRK